MCACEAGLGEGDAYETGVQVPEMGASSKVDAPIGVEVDVDVDMMHHFDYLQPSTLSRNMDCSAVQMGGSSETSYTKHALVRRQFTPTFVEACDCTTKTKLYRSQSRVSYTTFELFRDVVVCAESDGGTEQQAAPRSGKKKTIRDFSTRICRGATATATATATALTTVLCYL